LKSSDVPLILQFIRELADYEHALHEVEATEESLRATLSFPSPSSSSSSSTTTTTNPPDNKNKRGGPVYTALVSPSPSPSDPNPRPVGMALFFYNYSTWRSAPGVYLEDLYVQPHARGKGYGFALLRWLAQEVVRIGGRRLEWSVLRWNEPSIRFYESVGARRMDEWVKMMVEGEALGRLAGLEAADADGGKGEQQQQQQQQQETSSS